MISLDSVYAMLARPVSPKVKSKKKVKKIDNSAQIAADSHESPQSQLPPHLERRTSTDDRRKNQQIAYQLDPSLERRKGSRRDKCVQEEQDQKLEQEPSQSSKVREDSESTHTRIDIDV
ncbi:hypothetical protein L2719_09255 [Shewanella schlegeliana]|uniref:Uncharacterized protein n=1 Tax=Shewanella schlegeliana TaxID=190308 RepID=A0ABS1T1I8_9GAMM|nr:hypothetical protein [Shewanella schlegeliana]MBL4914455.1 hypothetical protein [Shewanella schlegeliana]MCL1109729.1 hypothetical protein [Shewanella schlegeliana]GIU33254.1 hypothetical protein TUM4433_27380 [Shewanella schlegeliana]